MSEINNFMSGGMDGDSDPLHVPTPGLIPDNPALHLFTADIEFYGQITGTALRATIKNHLPCTQNEFTGEINNLMATRPGYAACIELADNNNINP